MSEMNWEQIDEAFEECEKSGGIELCLTGVDCGTDDDRPEVLDEVLNLSFERFPDLEELSLHLGGEGLTLSTLEQHVEAQPTLRSLGLVVVGDTAMQALARRNRLLTKIDYLSLEGVGDEGLISVAAHAQHLTALRDLEFDACSFGDSGLKALADQLKQLVSLETIVDYESNDMQVTPDGCLLLLEFTGLKQLRLVGWPIDDAALEEISVQAQFASSLEGLDLLLTKVGDAGVTALARHASRFPRLKWLNLYGLDVGDDALKALALAWQRGAFRDLERVKFLGTRAQLVATEVLKTKDAAQIFEAALEGLALPEAKIVVLGEPGVGKTSLCRRLFRGREADPAKRRETHDFELIRPPWRPKVRDLEVGLRVWDFGGQHVLHGTHEMFLTSRSICLLVLDAMQVEERDPQVQDEEWDGNRLFYWLNMIRHFIGKDAHVILVVTKSDEPDDRLGSIDVDRLRINHHFTAPIQLVEGFSSTDKQCADPVKDLREAIRNALQQMDELHSRLPREFVVLKERVESEMEGRALVSLEEYRDWCRLVGVERPHVQDVHLRTLHHFGSIFYFSPLNFEQKKLQQSRSRNRSNIDDLPPGQRRWLKKKPHPALRRWLVNPQWLKRPLYELIRESKGQPWLDERTIRKAARRKRGELTIDDPNAAEDVVLAALELTELCFYDAERAKYFFPRALPTDSKQYLTGWDEASHHEISWKWHFFPEAVIHRFIVQAHKHGEVLNNTQWRTGVVLERGETTIAVQSEPEHGKVTLWLKKRSDNASRPTLQDEKFVDLLRHRLIELIGSEPSETVCRTWQEDTACAADASSRKVSAPQNGPESPDTVASTVHTTAGKLPLYAEKAYQAYKMAEQALGEPTDKEAYAWLKENCPPAYELSRSFDTWCKYVREGRHHYGTSKNSPRAGRSGGSVVREGEI